MLDLSLLPPSAAVEKDDFRIGGVLLRDLAQEFGTPAYVLDEEGLRGRARHYISAFTVLADLVGRHCEAGDVITPDVRLASPQVGDLIVVPVTGAYCFTIGNNYNAALRPPVVLCANGTARLAVRRETPEDLMAREVGLGGAPAPHGTR
jgi:diaminopimelate decarboxylase